jgi:ankyrin repeat protein
LSTEAQETDAQKLLLDSIHYNKLDVAGVKAALDKGANPNWVSDTPRDSVIGHLAKTATWTKEDKKAEEILQMLFKAGAKLQPCDQEILYYPIAYGWALFTEVLLKNGANPTREILGKTPMEIAVSNGQANIVELLRKYGVPALGKRIAVQLRFIRAARDNDIPLMEEAIRNGARVNEENRQEETALIEALGSLYFTRDNPAATATIQYLLQEGADPNIKSKGRAEHYWGGEMTALHITIRISSSIFDEERRIKMKGEYKNEHFKDAPFHARLIIESLLQHGAYVSARDSNGMTPLHIAAERNNIVAAKMLIEAGAKIMPRDNKGKTPLEYAESAEMIKLLKAHGAKEE